MLAYGGEGGLDVDGKLRLIAIKKSNRCTAQSMNRLISNLAKFGWDQKSGGAPTCWWHIGFE